MAANCRACTVDSDSEPAVNDPFDGLRELSAVPGEGKESLVGAASSGAGECESSYRVHEHTQDIGDAVEQRGCTKRLTESEWSYEVVVVCHTERHSKCHEKDQNPNGAPLPPVLTGIGIVHVPS